MADRTLPALHRLRERLELERIETRMRHQRASAAVEPLAAVAQKRLLTAAEQKILDMAIERRVVLERRGLELSQQLADAEQQIATLTARRLAEGAQRTPPRAPGRTP